MFRESFVPNHPYDYQPVFSGVNYCVSKETGVEILSPYRLSGIVAGIDSEDLPVRHTIQENQVNVKAEEGCTKRRFLT